jgi:LacI family transcriptional regulator
MRYANPPVTAIVQPIAAVTARAVQLIIEQRRTGHVPATPEIVPAEMVFRQTTGPVAAPR